MNSKLKVKWLDGGCYEGTVLGTSTALARVNPTGYPKEYTLWVTEKEIVFENATKKNNQQTGSMANFVCFNRRLFMVNICQLFSL